MKNNFFFYKCVQFLKKNTSVSRKSLLDRYKKCQFDNFTASIDGVPTSWHTLLQKKTAKKAQKNRHWPSPHAAEVEGKGIESLDLYSSQKIWTIENKNKTLDKEKL